MTGSRKITGEDVVIALKQLRYSVNVRQIAAQLGADTRAIATAARKPARDGRIKVRYVRGMNFALYRFVRMKPVEAKDGS